MVLEHILKECSDKINYQYDTLLWVVTTSWTTCGGDYEEAWTDRKYIKDLYYGTIEDVEKIVNLKYYTPKIEKYDILTHGIMKELNAVDEYKKHFVPKVSGDRIRYNGDTYTVAGFNSNSFGAKRDKDGEYININKNEKYEMIYSAYWMTKNRY